MTCGCQAQEHEMQLTLLPSSVLPSSFRTTIGPTSISSGKSSSISPSQSSSRPLQTSVLGLQGAPPPLPARAPPVPALGERPPALAPALLAPPALSLPPC